MASTQSPDQRPSPMAPKENWHNGDFKISGYCYDPNEISGRRRPLGT